MSRGKTHYDVTITIPVSSELKERLYDMAYEQDSTMPALVRKFIEEGMNKYGR